METDNKPGDGPAPETDFGQRLQSARHATGLTISEAARALGMKQPTLYELEKKGKSSGFTVRLARLYGVRAAWLEFGEEPRAATPGEPEDAWRAIAVESALHLPPNDQRFLRDFFNGVDAIYRMRNASRARSHTQTTGGTVR